MKHVTITETGILLSRLLAEKGFFPDLRCGGAGRCGRCRIPLRSGIWEEAGKRISAPALASACQTRLIQGPGVVDLAENEYTAQEETLPPPLHSYPDIPGPVVGIDLGTTTVAGAILQHGKILRCAKIANAQRAFGDNVIDRITAAERDRDTLRKAACFSLSKVIDALSPPENSFFSLAGNTVMLALLCGADPGSLGRAPFTVPEMDFSRIHVAAFGRDKGKGVLILPPLSAYLGGDVTAGWQETALGPGEMLVDIGTNCEILFHSEKQGLIGTSAAAGPAFEGGGIGCGSRVQRGVITHISAPNLRQISGGGQPCGISGTALVDLLFWARKTGRIDRCGKCCGSQELEAAPGMVLKEEEIALLLTAKAAICAGITALERFAGAPARKIYLAGDFAFHLNIRNAAAIGMLPADREYLAVGNTALSGALRAGCAGASGEPLSLPSPAPREIRPGELPDFAALFADSMLLP